MTFFNLLPSFSLKKRSIFQIDDPYLDVPRACICVQMLLEKFANKQLTVTESWEKWRTTIEILREKRIEHERKIEESTRVNLSNSIKIFLFLLSKFIYYFTNII